MKGYYVLDYMPLYRFSRYEITFKHTQLKKNLSFKQMMPNSGKMNYLRWWVFY